MENRTDEDLILMFLSGDAAAFEVIFKKYKGPIYTFLFRKCQNAEVASDLTQEVFAKVINKADTFKHEAKFSTWIYTIARNAAMDYLRKQKHRNHASVDQVTGEDGNMTLLDKIADGDKSPEDRSEAGDMQKAIAAAIESLPDDQKEVFILREYHGMPFKQIAKVVGAKTGTVKSRMRYALEHLRIKLRSYEEYARELP